MDSAKSSITEKQYPHSIETIKNHLKQSDAIISAEICDEKSKNNQVNCKDKNNLIASKNPNYIDGGVKDEDDEEDEYNNIDDKFRYNSKSQLYSAVINNINHANCSYISDIINDGANLKTRSLPWKKNATEIEESIKLPNNNQTKVTNQIVNYQPISHEFKFPFSLI